MKRNKFFSLSLMWEGIKQTKSMGIWLTIAAAFVSNIAPLALMFNNETSMVTIDVFATPITILMYFTPAIFIFTLFGFMNKRNASDFYHSAPLNRTCVYFTYSAVAMIWTAFIILASVFSEYIFYSSLPNAIITPSFMWVTIYNALIIAFLVLSIALVAKGITGTFFSGIIVAMVLMFVPRAIIMAFANSLTPIAPINSIPILNPNMNILFVQIMASQSNYATLMTDWGIMLYSFILAVVYFVVGLFIHRSRKSESAGSSVAFGWIRHIVRSLIGILPTLLICWPLAAGENLEMATVSFAIGVSVLAYFIYEFATTRSLKKLLYAVPLYLVVVVFNVAFVLGSQVISNSIMNNVPVESEVQSVTVTQNSQYYYTKSYEECKSESFEYKDKELIKIFSDCLKNNINTLNSEYGNHNVFVFSYKSYEVIFHGKDGKDIKRNVYVYDPDSFMSSEEDLNEKILRLEYEDENYRKSRIALPDDSEITNIYVTNIASVSMNSKCSDEEMQKIWRTFKNEYVSLSQEDKLITSGYNIVENYNKLIYCNMSLNGYVGVEPYKTLYLVSSTITPRTYKLILEISNKYATKITDDLEKEILESINKDAVFDISVYSNSNINDCYGMSYNRDEATPEELSSKDFEEVARAVKNLIDASKKGCDITKDNLYTVTLDISGLDMPKKTYQRVNDAALNPSVHFFVNLTDEEYKEFEDIAIAFFEKQGGEILVSE